VLEIRTWILLRQNMDDTWKALSASFYDGKLTLVGLNYGG